MMLGPISIAALTAGMILSATAQAFAETRTPTALKTGYAPVNGLKTYYEIHGTGEPLILLHGGARSLLTTKSASAARLRPEARVCSHPDRCDRRARQSSASPL